MTTSRPRLTVLTQAMRTKKGSSNCSVCNDIININDKIVSKQSHSFKWYHIECAKRVNII